MKSRISTLLLALFLLALFCSCYYKPASSPASASIQTPQLPCDKVIDITPVQFVTSLSAKGIPVHIISSEKNKLCFQDRRIKTNDTDVSGTLLLYSDSAEASNQYHALILQNAAGQYIYQFNNLLLLLSPNFTKSQARQYKQLFYLFGDLDDVESPSVSSSSVTSSGNNSSTSYKDGTYVVGSLLPAGEYVIKNSGHRCIVTLTDGTNRKHIIYKNTFFHNILLTVRSTEVLTIKNGVAIPISDCKLDTSEEGMFKVGTHLSAGTYQVRLSVSNLVGLGSIQILKDSRYEEDSVISSRMLTKPTTITLKEGEYIRLSGACLSKID